jgi:hypothetical protein
VRRFRNQFHGIIDAGTQTPARPIVGVGAEGGPASEIPWKIPMKAKTTKKATTKTKPAVSARDLPARKSPVGGRKPNEQNDK